MGGKKGEINFRDPVTVMCKHTLYFQKKIFFSIQFVFLAIDFSELKLCFHNFQSKVTEYRERITAPKPTHLGEGKSRHTHTLIWSESQQVISSILDHFYTLF